MSNNYSYNTRRPGNIQGGPTIRSGYDNGYSAAPNSSRVRQADPSPNYTSSNNPNMRSIAREVVNATRELQQPSHSPLDKERGLYQLSSGKAVYMPNNLFDDGPAPPQHKAHSPLSPPTSSHNYYTSGPASQSSVTARATASSSTYRPANQTMGMGMGMNQRSSKYPYGPNGPNGPHGNAPTGPMRSSPMAFSVTKVIVIVIVAVVASLLAFRTKLTPVTDFPSSPLATTTSNGAEDSSFVVDSSMTSSESSSESKGLFSFVRALFSSFKKTPTNAKDVAHVSAVNSLVDSHDVSEKVEKLLRRAHRGVAACVASNLLIQGRCPQNTVGKGLGKAQAYYFQYMEGVSPSSFSRLANQTLTLPSYIFTNEYDHSFSSAGNLQLPDTPNSIKGSEPIKFDGIKTPAVYPTGTKREIAPSSVWLCPAANMDTFADISSPYVIDIHNQDDFRVSFSLRNTSEDSTTRDGDSPHKSRSIDTSLRTRLLQRPLPPVMSPVSVESLIPSPASILNTNSNNSTATGTGHSLKDIAHHIERASASISALDTALNELYSGEKVVTETEVQQTLLDEKMESEARLYRASCQALLRDSVYLAMSMVAVDEGRAAAELAELALNTVHDTVGSRSSLLRNARTSLNNALRAQGTAEQELVAASDQNTQLEVELANCTNGVTDYQSQIIDAKAKLASAQKEDTSYTEKLVNSKNTIRKLQSREKKAKRRLASTEKQLQSLEQFVGLASNDSVPDVGRALVNAISKVRKEIEELEQGVLRTSKDSDEDSDPSADDDEDDDDDDEEDNYALNFLKNQRLRELRSTLEHLEGVRARFNPDESMDENADGKKILDLVQKLRQKKVDGGALVEKLAGDLTAEQRLLASLQQNFQKNQQFIAKTEAIIQELERKSKVALVNRENCITTSKQALESAKIRLTNAHKGNEKARSDVVIAKTALFDREAASKKEEDKASQALDLALARAKSALSALHPASEALSLSVFENDRNAGTLSQSIEQHRVVLQSLQQALIAYEQSYHKAIEMRSTLLNILL